jgi:hypothetical protein
VDGRFENRLVIIVRDPESRRWRHYFMRQGLEFQKFWSEYLQTKRDILFILGWGFDPRMCIGLEAILESGGTGLRDCWLVDFDEGEASPSRKHDPLRSANLVKLNQLINGKMNKHDKKIPMVGEDGHRIEGRKAAKVFTNFADLKKYSDILVDISAMPISIYFPLLGNLLYLVDKNKAETTLNIHVVVAENAELDAAIRDREIEEDAKYLFGFASDLAAESTAMSKNALARIPKVWIPIIGEDKHTQLERISIVVKPDEICPVLPSPARNLRRSDNLILEYRDLFTRLPVELRNIVYGSEQNPFEVYREIFDTVDRYYKALKALGGCKVAVSPLSSKLLSMSAFLVAYEAINTQISVGVAYVVPKGYAMDASVDSTTVNNNTKLFSLWLAGEVYAR